VGGNAARGLMPALLVLGLVGFVAIASTGSSSAGTSEARKPSEVLLDIFFSFALVAFIPAAAMLVWGLMQRREIAAGIASGRFGRRRSLVSFLAVAAALGAVAYWRIRDPRFQEGEQLEDVIVPRGAPTPAVGEDEATQYQAEFAWIPVFVVVVLAALGLAAYHLSNRRRRGATGAETVALVVAEVLDDTLDLRAERDPRKAVIAAYARLERALAAHGSARKAAETPDEYLERILPRLAVGRSSIRRLTDLFTWAKFSPHEVDPKMKKEAIEALEQVRDELRPAAEAPDAEPPSQSPLKPRAEGA
jgi:Domain of unknown function (DUF4129)